MIALLLSSTVLAATVSPPPKATPFEDTNVTTITATIEAINHGDRTIVVVGPKGRAVTIKVPPEVKRFSAMKVGDVLTARYKEALVVAIAEPGSPAPPPDTSDPTVIPLPGERPAATIDDTVKVRVRIEAIDRQAPALTVKKANGELVDLKVKDPRRLERVKVGDDIDISYKESLLLTVDSH